MSMHPGQMNQVYHPGSMDLATVFEHGRNGPTRPELVSTFPLCASVMQSPAQTAQTQRLPPNSSAPWFRKTDQQSQIEFQAKQIDEAIHLLKMQQAALMSSVVNPTARPSDNPVPSMMCPPTYTQPAPSMFVNASPLNELDKQKSFTFSNPLEFSLHRHDGPGLGAVHQHGINQVHPRANPRPGPPPQLPPQFVSRCHDQGPAMTRISMLNLLQDAKHQAPVPLPSTESCIPTKRQRREDGSMEGWMQCSSNMTITGEPASKQEESESRRVSTAKPPIAPEVCFSLPS